MSGINTLIDTLMHQVLGRRVDIQPPRELNQPVKPMTPTDAATAVRSDSRLDRRINTPIREAGQAAREPPGTRLGRQTGGDRAPPPSTQTSFTASARSIADLMLRFPTAQSAVRLPQPLFPTTEAQAPTQVAERLQHSVRDSGLFYESHVSRWFRGELSRDQLQREPQMWRPLIFTPAPAENSSPAPLRSSWPALLFGLGRGGEAALGQERGQGPAMASAGAKTGAPPVIAGAAGGAASSTPPSSLTNQPVGSEARESAAIAERALSAEVATRLARTEARQPIHESLQGIVRHQLELLATPVLRWEGDVWSGIFMALMVQPPAVRREEGGAPGEDSGQKDESDDQEWHSSLLLRVSGLGEVGVKLWLRESRLELELAANDPEVRAALEQGIDRLKTRLEAQELSQVIVRLRTDLTEPGTEATG